MQPGILSFSFIRSGSRRSSFLGCLFWVMMLLRARLRFSGCHASFCETGDDNLCRDVGNDCCAPLSINEVAKCDGGFSPVPTGQGCFGFQEGKYTCCSVPHPPPARPSPPPPPRPPPYPPLPPYTNHLSPAKCEALFREKDGMLTQMWNKKGWRQVRKEEPCWNWGGANPFFDNALSGGSCNSNWFEGSYQGVSADRFTEDAIAVLGFDDSIERYCNSLYNWNGRRIDETNGTVAERNVSRAEGARRRLEATRQVGHRGFLHVDTTCASLACVPGPTRIAAIVISSAKCTLSDFPLTLRSSVCRQQPQHPCSIRQQRAQHGCRIQPVSQP